MGLLITGYVFFLAPVSGFSINPARTFGSAALAGVWTSIWIYFTAPLLGMFAAAEIYVRLTRRRTAYFTHRHLIHHPAKTIQPEALARNAGSG